MANSVTEEHLFLLYFEIARTPVFGLITSGYKKNKRKTIRNLFENLNFETFFVQINLIIRPTFCIVLITIK